MFTLIISLFPASAVNFALCNEENIVTYDVGCFVESFDSTFEELYQGYGEEIQSIVVLGPLDYTEPFTQKHLKEVSIPITLQDSTNKR